MTTTVQHELAQATRLLGPVSDTPRLDAEVLLGHALRRQRTYLFAHPEQRLAQSEITAFSTLTERRANGEPIAYICGTKEFWSLPLSVSRGVLVPRPETELLVELALRCLPAHEARVADLGTGSGAIALALAHERPDWELIATDVSRDALEVAKVNA
ncbi:MAG: HemK/PrmC family methyltransferase, partial [Gammaproteobacteria bacterium]